MECSAGPCAGDCHSFQFDVSRHHCCCLAAVLCRSVGTHFSSDCVGLDATGCPSPISKCPKMFRYYLYVWYVFELCQCFVVVFVGCPEMVHGWCTCTYMCMILQRMWHVCLCLNKGTDMQFCHVFVCTQACVVNLCVCSVYCSDRTSFFMELLVCDCFVAYRTIVQHHGAQSVLWLGLPCHHKCHRLLFAERALAGVPRQENAPLHSVH
jgi:hypothetical protein